MSIPALETVLGLTQVVIATIILMSGKEARAKPLFAGLLLVALVVTLAPPIEAIENALNAVHLLQPLAIIDGALCLIAAYFIDKHRTGALLCAIGTLMLGHGLRLIGGWAL
jgi:hypothetical protein